MKPERKSIRQEKVSLIMTTYNCAEHIEGTLQSALAQDYPNLEIVIADGGSTDGTVDVIRRYANAAKTAQQAGKANTVISWRSEKDKGIYGGMNRAIERSAGEILAVFNDLFTRKDAVSLMVEAIHRGDDLYGAEHCIGAHADLAYMEGNRVVRKWVMGDGRIQDGWLPAHPAMYLKRSVYERYGLYDLSYASSSDYEFMVRVLKDPNNRLAYLHEELIHMYYGGTSSAGLSGYGRNVREAYQALRKNKIPHAWIIILRRVLRTLQQFR